MNPRCDSCGAEVSVLDRNGDGISCRCAMSNPLERGAIAAAGATPDHWVTMSATGREAYRDLAATVLRAAVDVDELAEHIGPDHAQIVRNHLLGSAHD